jgi:hypothetical protein
MYLLPDLAAAKNKGHADNNHLYSRPYFEEVLRRQQYTSLMGL